tara:strand:- start:77194 stop:78114 length:921 start_codon:yes stop_codon:yes gene_type:complete
LGSKKTEAILKLKTKSMKTIKTNTKRTRASIASLTLATLLLSFFVFTSCSENSDGINLSSDATLIDQIDTANRTVVGSDDLPTSTQTTFNGELNDNFINQVELANALGYKVAVSSVDESRMENSSDVYFDLQGRQLDDTRDRSRRRRNRCFEFVFPIDFIMPDDSSITLNSKDEWSLIRDWYTANPDATEKPELVFPVDVTLEDGTVQTLIDVEDLREVKNSCRADRDRRKCFRFVLPVSFTMPDGSVIDVNERRDFKLIRQWHKDNPDVDEKGVVNFPVDIEYRDGTVATINDETELEAAKQACN